MVRKSDLTWIKDYEFRRTSGKEEISQLLQVRPDLQGLSWNEIREREVPRLVFEGRVLNIGSSFSMLKKSWRSYRLYRKDGIPAQDLELRILKIQYRMGLPLSEFPDLDPEWVQNELDREETEEIDEDPLYKTLREEERSELIELRQGIIEEFSKSQRSEW